jgi:methylmalonyl-CoA/ethylmalonyl-CoA epimerase
VNVEYRPGTTDADRSSKLPAEIVDLVIDLDHVAIAVPELNEAIRWYVDGLGFRLIERRATRGASTGMISAVLAAGRAIVVLIQGTSAESQVSRFIDNFGPGVQHIAFAVTDIEQALARIENAGGAADIPMIVEDGIRQVFLRRDPGSGVRVELIERRGGTFSDRSVEQLFRAFEARELV